MKFILTLLLLCSFSISSAEKKKILLTSDDTIFLSTEFTNNTVAEVMKQALDLHQKLPPFKEINFVINSPGGSIVAGLRLITFLNSLDRKVNVICVFCASMAFITMQHVNGNRILTEYGTLMSHKASGGFDGEFPGQLTNRLSYWLDRLEKIDQKVVDRSNGKQTLIGYKELYENEYWCDDSTCVEQGFADEVANITCGSGFTGLSKRNIDTFFGSFEVYISKCPIIGGIIKMRKVDEDGNAYGPYINPSPELDSMEEIWIKMGIKNINKINLNER